MKLLQKLGRALLLRRPKFALALICILPVAICIPSQAQVVPVTSVVISNLPGQISGGATSNLFTAGKTPTNNVISIRQGIGLATQLQFIGTNAASTGPIVFNWALSYDGSNFSTSTLLPVIINASGATVTIGGSNFPSYLINNALYASPYSITNGCASTNTLIFTNAAGGVAGSTNNGQVVGLGNITPTGF